MQAGRVGGAAGRVRCGDGMTGLPASTPRKPEETRRLAELEDVVARGLETFIAVGDALREIRDRRLYRLTHPTFEKYCRDRWGMDRRHANRHIEAADVAGVLGSVDPIRDPDGEGLGGPRNVAQAREIASLVREDEREAIEVWRELKSEHGERLTATMIRRLVRPRLERLRREEEAAHEQASAPAPVPLRDGDVRVERADFRDLDMEPGSADLILTDPPYGTEYLPLWGDLADFASQALRPGGVLACYAGQRLLPEYLDQLRRRLDYRWTVATEHLRGSAHIFDRRVQNRWKPVLIFSRGIPYHAWLTDFLRCGDRNSKKFHPWGQAEGEAARLIETLTKPGDLVLDPFSGGGTVPAVAARLGRRVVACDVDAEAHAATISRVRDAAPLLRETP